jgi:hypothetical protein
MQFIEYTKLDAKQATSVAARLIEAAAVSGAWISIDLPERLAALREIVRKDRKAA